jgi:hypothetical protein
MHGTDEIWLRAYNGAWSNNTNGSWTLADITDPGLAPPVVTATNQTVAYGQSVALTNIFSVSGSGITQYQLWFSLPEGGAPALGTVTNNGTPVAPDQTVTLGSLNGLLYTGSAMHGTDEIMATGVQRRLEQQHQRQLDTRGHHRSWGRRPYRFSHRRKPRRRNFEPAPFLGTTSCMIRPSASWAATRATVSAIPVKHPPFF